MATGEPSFCVWSAPTISLVWHCSRTRFTSLTGDQQGEWNHEAGTFVEIKIQNTQKVANLKQNEAQSARAESANKGVNRRYPEITVEDNLTQCFLTHV